MRVGRTMTGPRRGAPRTGGSRRLGRAAVVLALVAGACSPAVPATPSATPSAAPMAVLHVENRGGPAFVIRIGGREVTTVNCDGGETLIPGQAGVPHLPWAFEVERVHDGKLILTREVADLPRWLVQIGEALVGNLPTSPVEGVPGPSCPPEG